MNEGNLNKIVRYIVDQGLDAIVKNTEEKYLPVDYLAIFCHDDNEYYQLDQFVAALGEIIDQHLSKTGNTYLLHKPISTNAGDLKMLKIRKPDATRPQRGAPDFQVTDYNAFKEKYLSAGGNFTLMPRKDYEMIELKGIDALVYFPSKSFDERQG